MLSKFLKFLGKMKFWGKKAPVITKSAPVQAKKKVLKRSIKGHVTGRV